MGKYIFLAVVVVAFGVTVLANQGLRTDQDTSRSQAARQEKVLARQIAQSAFQDGLAELRRDFENWRVDRENVAYENGTFDLSASGPSTGPVSLTAVGTFGDFSYEIVATARLDTSVNSLFNGITTQTPVDFSVSGGGCSGAPCVSGKDVGGEDDRRGISLPPDGDPKGVCDEFDDAVEGKGEGCDVATRSSKEEEWVEREMEALHSDIQAAIDRGSEDVTECNGCDLSDLSTDTGVLYVTGELRINGEEQWNGPVFVADGGSVQINGGGDTRNINGGLVMSDSTSYDEDEEFDMNGGNAVQYNSDQLKKYMDTIPTIRTTTVEVTERTGGFVDTSG